MSPLARSNAAQWRTHIRRRNRKRSDGAAAAVRSVAAALRVLATWSSFDTLLGLLDGGLTRLWEVKVHRNDRSFRRSLDCIERSGLSDRSQR
jgi:hypothetical protein